MALTLTELQEKLKKIDEVSLMEVLEITSEDLVMRFIDRIDERYDDLIIDFESDFEEEETTEWWEKEDLDLDDIDNVLDDWDESEDNN